MVDVRTAGTGLGAASVTAVVTAATVGTGLALAARPAWEVALAVLLAPSVSVALLAVLLARRSRRTCSGAGTDPVAAVAAVPQPPSPWAPQEQEVARAERRLVELVRAGAEPRDESALTAASLALYEARLHLVRVLLQNGAPVPAALRDELLVQHRGVTAMLRARTGPAG